jgi:hypothetical protein
LALTSAVSDGGRQAISRELEIRSGGQTGVDRAALDAAIQCGRPYIGWCPKGGWADDFHDPPGLLTKYPLLQETPGKSPQQRTDWNVRDSTATIILVPDLEFHSAGTKLTIAYTTKYGKSCALLKYGDADCAAAIRDILREASEDQSLNFAGPRECEYPGAYAQCMKILVEAFER